MSRSLALLLPLLLATTLAVLTQLSPKNFEQKVNDSPYLLLYIYSSSCAHCREFTPTFERLSKHPELQQLSVAFAKMDGPAYENLTHSLEAFSYPTLLLFKKGVPLPLHYRRERKE
jgi:thiol-disulfide isomerase/thioredoxin